MTKKRKIVMSALLGVALLWTAFIFSRSMQTGAESSVASGRLTALLQGLLGGIPVSELLVRKLAHFAEYMILAFPVTAALLLVRRRWLPLFSWGYALLVACADEFVVQAMTTGRGPRFTDVLIDGAGAFVGMAVMMLGFVIAEKMNLLKK